MGISPYPTPRPMLYLFRSKLNCYTAQNAVNGSILLVDFDHGVHLAVSEMNNAQYLAYLLHDFNQFYALKGVR